MLFVNQNYLNKKDAKILKAQIEQQTKERRMLEADYEARLKADLEAILTEIQLEIDEEYKTNIDGSFPLDGGYDNAYNNGLGKANHILKLKIDKLKGVKE